MQKQRAYLLSVLLAALAISVLVSAASCSTRGENQPSLLFFRSSTCPYCKQMSPVVDGIRSKYRGELNVIYATLEDEKGRELADQYGIIGFPVILLLDGQGERVSLLRGVVPQPSLEQAVEDLIQSVNPHPEFGG